MRLFTNSVLCAVMSAVAIAQYHHGWDHYYGTAVVPVGDSQVTVVAGHHPEWDHYYGTAVVPVGDSQVTVVAGHHPEVGRLQLRD